MKIFILLALAFALHAQDAPSPTVEQLQAKVSEQQREIVDLQQLLAQASNTAQELADAYTGCKASRDQIAKQQRPPAPSKSESK